MPGVTGIYALRLTYARCKGCKLVPRKRHAIRGVNQLIKLHGKLVLVHTNLGVGTNPIIRHPRQIGQRFLRYHLSGDCTQPPRTNGVEDSAIHKGVAYESSVWPWPRSRRVEDFTLINWLPRGVCHSRNCRTESGADISV